MSIIKFKIDEKSLWFGIKNNYKKGHSATVTMPLNQSVKKKKFRTEALCLEKSKFRIKKPSKNLIEDCLKCTTSKVEKKFQVF